MSSHHFLLLFIYVNHFRCIPIAPRFSIWSSNSSWSGVSFVVGCAGALCGPGGRHMGMGFNLHFGIAGLYGRARLRNQNMVVKNLNLTSCLWNAIYTSRKTYWKWGCISSIRPAASAFGLLRFWLGVAKWTQWSHSKGRRGQGEWGIGSCTSYPFRSSSLMIYSIILWYLNDISILIKSIEKYVYMKNMISQWYLNDMWSYVIWPAVSSVSKFCSHNYPSAGQAYLGRLFAKHLEGYGSMEGMEADFSARAMHKGKRIRTWCEVKYQISIYNFSPRFLWLVGWLTILLLKLANRRSQRLWPYLQRSNWWLSRPSCWEVDEMHWVWNSTWEDWQRGEVPMV